MNVLFSLVGLETTYICRFGFSMCCTWNPCVSIYFTSLPHRIMSTPRAYNLPSTHREKSSWTPKHHQPSNEKVILEAPHMNNTVMLLSSSLLSCSSCGADRGSQTVPAGPNFDIFFLIGGRTFNTHNPVCMWDEMFNIIMMFLGPKIHHVYL